MTVKIVYVKVENAYVMGHVQYPWTTYAILVDRNPDIGYWIVSSRTYSEAKSVVRTCGYQAYTNEQILSRNRDLRHFDPYNRILSRNRDLRHFDPYNRIGVRYLGGEHN
jgi:hypothetical protein